jgi:hypothetical protein
MFPGLGAPAAYAVAMRQGTALQDRFEARRDNQAEIARFREAAPRIADVDALLKDRRALKIVLEAFQLESEIDKRGILRKVLTEPPDEQGSLVNRLADPRWRELARAFAETRPVALSTSQVAALDGGALRGLALNQMAGLNAAQVQALTTTQVTQLEAAQLAAIDPDAFGAMDAADLAALDSRQVAALGAAQIGALGPTQVAAIEPADIAALGAAQLRGLGAFQIAGLTTAQLGALRLEQVEALDATQRAAFSPAQRAALGAAQQAALTAPAPFVPAQAGAAAPRAPLADRVLLDRIVDGMVVNRFEKAMGEANPGLREALYFRRMAGTVTRLPELMADRALTTVVRGALSLPESFGALDFDQQRDLLARRLDLTKLQDPREVDRMARRYLALAAPQAAQTGYVASLFGGGPSLTSLVGQSLSLRA